jgi:signal peptidase II
VALDQLTKWWVETALSLGESRHVLGPVDIIRVSNYEGAWGLSGPKALWVTFSSIAVVVVLVFFFRYLTSPHPLTSLGLGVLLGGTISNLVDRIFAGYVTDFINVSLGGDVNWPAFNIADIAIVVGVLLIIYTLVLPKKPSES